MSTATLRRAPSRGPRRDLEERLDNVRRSIEALDLIIEQLYSVCHVAGASNGGTIDEGTHGFGENDSEDALRDAWKRVTSLGVERKALRKEAAALTAALDELEHQGTELACQVCGTKMQATRKDQRYCSNACKQRAWRQGMARVTPSKRRAPQTAAAAWIDD